MNAQISRVNVHELMDKFRSKRELYNFLEQDCKAFQPKPSSTNVYFYKQIARGQKEVAAVPQIERLTVEDFLLYAKDKPDFLRYFPEEKDWLHLDKQWICNVLYSLDPDGQTIKKQKIEQTQNLMVSMRPEFVEALHQSFLFSSKFRLLTYQQVNEEDLLFYQKTLLRANVKEVKQRKLKQKKIFSKEINQNFYKKQKGQKEKTKNERIKFQNQERYRMLLIIYLIMELQIKKSNQYCKKCNKNNKIMFLIYDFV